MWQNIQNVRVEAEQRTKRAALIRDCELPKRSFFLKTDYVGIGKRLRLVPQPLAFIFKNCQISCLIKPLSTLKVIKYQSLWPALKLQMKL